MEHLGANQTGPKKLLQNTGSWQLDTDLLANFEISSLCSNQYISCCQYLPRNNSGYCLMVSSTTGFLWSREAFVAVMALIFSFLMLYATFRWFNHQTTCQELLWFSNCNWINCWIILYYRCLEPFHRILEITP